MKIGILQILEFCSSKVKVMNTAKLNVVHLFPLPVGLETGYAGVNPLMPIVAIRGR